KDIGEIEETTQVQKERGRESRGSGNHGKGNHGRGTCGIRNLEREANHRANQRGKERETSIEPTPNIECNDSDSDYEKEIELDI
ncbi:14035_t:CDS:2, partial [Gigaspora rosea]